MRTTAFPTTVDEAEERRRSVELDEFVAELMNDQVPQASLIAALHKVQELYGYLRKDVTMRVAARLGVSASRVWGVSTFYHYFNIKPRGKYMVSVCMGTACYVKGGARVLDAVQEYLGVEVGETTGEMMFTFCETRCLGACGLGPVMMVNGRIHGRLTPKKAVDILASYRRQA